MDGSDIDLVAAALGIDARGAAELLAKEGGVAAVARLDAIVLARVLREIGHRSPARAARALASGMALGRRAALLDVRLPERFTCSEDAATWGTPRLSTLVHEELWILALDSRGGLRAARCVAKGGLHGVGARVPDVLRAAIGVGASAFVLVHNHPGGDATPSPEDLRFTRIVADAARVVDVPLVDHVVVARSGFASVPLSGG